MKYKINMQYKIFVNKIKFDIDIEKFNFTNSYE